MGRNRIVRKPKVLVRIHPFFVSTTANGRITTELPSTEEPSGSRAGVGSLPGKTSEPAVAALPEEKAGQRKCYSPCVPGLPLITL
jgi:hypothetical protein